MDFSLAIRSYSLGGVSHARLSSPVEKISSIPTTDAIRRRSFLFSSSSPYTKRKVGVVSILKTTEAPLTAKPNNGVSLEKSDTLRSATFPNEFHSLVQEVCDDTEIAELKLKVGGFEMHLKRNIGATKAQTPMSNISPTTPLLSPTKPMEVSTPVAVLSSVPKPSEKASPFTNVSFGKSSKLAALEASGASGYVLVASPTVGSFRRNRTVKGKKQPPLLKEGDLIKDGQVLGYLDQFGTELPVKSDVDGEVLKLLFDDGEAVGYGDPLIAVSPSFHGIN